MYGITMKNYIQTLFLVITIIVIARSTTLASEHPSRLAVLSIENSAHLFPGYVQSMPTMLVTELVQKTGEQLVERAKIEDAMKELGLESGGVTADGSMKIGQWVGADRVLLGNFNQIGSSYRLDLRVIEVATGKILAASQASVRDDLASLIPQAVTNLASSLALRPQDSESAITINQVRAASVPQGFLGKGHVVISHRIILGLLTEKPVPFQMVRILVDGKLQGASTTIDAVNKDYILFDGDLPGGPHVITLEHCVVSKNGVWKRNLEVQPQNLLLEINRGSELNVTYRMRVGNARFEFEDYQVQ
jgi:hypothetical protein